jgi:hypothetical protein
MSRERSHDMRIKIISDGTGHGTKVINADTGEPVEFVTSVEWWILDSLSTASCRIELAAVEVDVVGELVDDRPEEPET